MPFWKREKNSQQESPKNKQEDLLKDLAELGLSLDFTVKDQATALSGGIAKANLRFAYNNFKKGNVEQAISSVTAIIADFENDPQYRNLLQSYPSYKKVLGAAFFVLGLCHESKNLRADAARDFEAAVWLHPGFTPAEEGLTRANRT